MADESITAPTSTATVQQPAQAAEAQPVQPVTTFTQADLDRIVKERIERERAKFADYSELKTAKAELDQIKAAQMSEEDKRQAKIKELEDLAASAQADSAAALAKANERLLRAAIIAAASEAGFITPGDAYALVDMAAVAVSEDGEVLGADEAVKALAEKRPYLLRKAQPLAPDLNGAAVGGKSASALPVLTEEQERVAKRLGVKPEVYAQRLAETQARLRR